MNHLDRLFTVTTRIEGVGALQISQALVQVALALTMCGWMA